MEKMSGFAFVSFLAVSTVLVSVLVLSDTNLVGHTTGYCQNCSNYCVDSDKGINFLVKGNTYGFRDNKFYNFSDRCLNKETVTEYYCRNNSYSGNKYSCLGDTTSGCLDGRCVKK